MSSKKSTPYLYILALGAALFIGACSHKIKPVDIPQTANPTAEVDALAADLNTARGQRVDVLAPESFKQAEESLKDAQKKRDKNKKGEKILKDVGYGRAYLNRAQTAAAHSQNQLADVMKARDQAIAGGAQNHHSELTKLDKRLKKYTIRIEQRKQIDRSDLTELQADYLDLELKAIKNVKLSEAKNTLENAEKNGAKQIVPKAYQESKEKLQVAEKAIETDRHDQGTVDQASLAAVESARRTMALLNTAKENKKRSPEQIAKEIETRNSQIGQAGAMTAAAQAEAAARAAELSNKDQQFNNEKAQLGAQLSAAEQEKEALEKREQFNRVFEEARAEFGKEEADVYRQGDNMIIRLKSIKFSPGRSELPSAALPVLNKVKNVIGQLKTEDIIVEGHTDSTGSAVANKKLSSERASAVADYFIAENSLAADKVESVGFGYEKPIATNKNKEGRAKNRRVDIVIKPTLASSANRDNPETSEKSSPTPVQ